MGGKQNLSVYSGGLAFSLVFNRLRTNLATFAFVKFEFCSELNPLTPRVKALVMQNFLTFDSMDGSLKFDHSSESC